MSLKRLLTALFLLLLVTPAYAGIDLPYQTTFDCDQEWTAYAQPLDCDGLRKGGDWVTSPDGKRTEIVHAANMEAGAGGMGHRDWAGVSSYSPTNNNTSGSNVLEFNTPQTELWIRWYMRWQEGFTWSNNSVNYDKILHFEGSPGNFYAGFYGSDGWRFRVYGTDDNKNDGPWGWASTMGGPTGDGLWHCYEIHVKRETSDSAFDGIAEYWIDGDLKKSWHNVDYDSVEGWTKFLFKSNQYNVDHGTPHAKAIDIDDMAISNTGYIGPLDIGPCIDGDNDNYGTGNCLGPDCDDNNSDVHQSISCSFDGQGCGSFELCQASCPTAPAEDCFVIGDEDCDGLSDCADTDCADSCGTCGNTDTEAGEQCDDGNTTTETCVYGETSCTVCDGFCQLVAGATSYCGDSHCDIQNEDQTSCAADCTSTSPDCGDLALLMHLDDLTDTVSGSAASNNGASLTTGIYGSAYDFDGSSSFIDFGDSEDLDFAAGDFTLSAWVKPRANQGTIIYKGGYLPSIAGYILSVDSSGHVEFEASDGTTRPISGVATSSLTTDGSTWHHLAAVLDRDVGYYVYIDGNLAFSGTIDTTGFDFSSDENLVLGARSNSTRFFNGLIDEVTIWGRTLGASEIAALGEQSCSSLSCEQDMDQDNYGVGAHCLGLDCDDNNSSLFQAIDCEYDGSSCGEFQLCLASCPIPPAEDCATTGDEDCDGLADCTDPDCLSAPDCQAPSCSNQGYSCCKACLSGPHTEFDGDCDGSCCEVCDPCGDGTCDAAEDCASCPADCLDSTTQVCCSGVIYSGDCCVDSDCTPDVCLGHSCGTPSTCEQDADSDRYGTGPGCLGPDCDDSNPDINPGVSELCNGVDDNCTGGIDEDWAQLGQPCSAGIGLCQAHGQLICSANRTTTQCNAEAGSPVEEICGDGLDQDCSGSDLDCTCVDNDDDGFHDSACGGKDCDDHNELIHPIAKENCSDDIDNDCDGLIDQEDTAACSDVEKTPGCNCSSTGFQTSWLMGFLLVALAYRSRQGKRP